MGLWKSLWCDETGVLLSAEAVVVGTVAVVGVTAGLSTLASSANEELKDMAVAIRSLDQSYSIPEHKGCGAWTAGSSFQQQPVKESVRELEVSFEKSVKAQKAQAERLQEQLMRQQEQARKEQQREQSEKRKDDERKPEVRKPQPRESDSRRPVSPNNPPRRPRQI